MVFYIPSAYTPAASPTPRYHIDRYTSYDSYGKYGTKSYTPTPTLSASSCVDTPFTIPSGLWYDRAAGTIGSSSVTVNQYCSTYGAPEKVYYGSPYSPAFAIFQDGKFVKYVNADVGILEVNGRTSYSFNATAGSVGCKSDPVSLKYGKSFPSSYTPCYNSPVNSLSNSKQEYEIINGTNYNRITWTNGVNGIYLFQAQVLDPAFSYCKLTTNFAVEVEGAPANIGWQILIVGLIDLFGMMILIISYFWYSHIRKTLRNSIQDDDDDDGGGKKSEKPKME